MPLPRLNLPQLTGDPFFVDLSGDIHIGDGGGAVYLAKTTGLVYIGEDDAVAGILSLYSDGTSSTQGGETKYFVAADHDGTISFFSVQAYEADLRIGRSTKEDDIVLKANGQVNLSQGAGYLEVGTTNGVFGQIVASGGPTSQDQGGMFEAEVAADFDTTIAYYRFEAHQDDLRIGPATDPDSLKYDGGTGVWNFTGAAGVKIGAGATITSTATTVADPGTDANLVTEQGIREALAASMLLGFSEDRALRPSATGDDAVVFESGEVVIENAAGTRVRLTMPASITKTVTGKTASTMSYFYAAIPASGVILATGDITANETAPTHQADRGLMDAAGNLKYIGSIPVDGDSDFYITHICCDGAVLFDSAPDIGALQKDGFTDVDVSAYCPSVDHARARVSCASAVNAVVKTRHNGSGGTGTPWQINAGAARATYYEVPLDAAAVYELDTAGVNCTANFVIGYREWR